MANKFYASGAARAGQVRALFDSIAPRYDLINDFQSFGLHRRWKSLLIRMARVRPGESVLDVCCGTGDIALRMAEVGGRVAGLDFSQPMLAIARDRASRSTRTKPVAHPAANSNPIHGSSLSFICADALRTPFHNAQFDAVTISYGLRNLADFQCGLREMIRVLRPGGRLVVLDFGKPQNPIWRALYFFYLRAAVPLLGRIVCGDWDAYAYILESLKQFPGQSGVGAMMREECLTNVKTLHLLGGIMGLNYGEKAAAPSDKSADEPFP